MEFIMKPKDSDRISINLLDQALTVGRSNRCSVQLDDSKISRVHCVIEKKNGRPIIRDLNSKNGIKINGTIKQECQLKHGDIILIGQAICLLRNLEN